MIPKGKNIVVNEGDYVRAGDSLMDGAVNPHDILKIKGEHELAHYLVDEIQEVYRLQGVKINDKHIEVICRQMLRRVRITHVGDSDFLVDQPVDKWRFEEANRELMADGGAPAQAEPLLLGYHQGIALYRLFLVRSVLPRDHSRAHRGVHQRPRRHAARPQGEHPDGSSDPRGYGLCFVPEAGHGHRR